MSMVGRSRRFLHSLVLGAALLGVLVQAGCGGGGGGDAASAVPAGVGGGGTSTLTVARVGGGVVLSSPAGIVCGATCSASFNDGTVVSLTATPDAGFAFEAWSGGCSGSGGCTITADQSKSVTASFVPVTPVAGAPYVVYTDTLSAPVSGGEGGQGGYLSIFGRGFGASSGLGTTTKVYIGGVEVANYRYLGQSKVAGKLGLQQLTVQVGALGGAAAGTALPVKVVVGGVASNVNNTFTPTSGRVLFVSLSGQDSTAVAGDISKPWRYLQNNGAGTGAYYASRAGDQVVLRGGNWSDTNGVDGTWMRASSGSSARNGTASAWIHFTAYPGPVNGNAIEDVHYTTPSGRSGGIAGPWSAITGTSGEYFAVSNLRMDVNASAAADAAPINFQYVAGPWRVVNNELGPWPVAGVSAAQAAGIAGEGIGMQILGNHIHDIGGTSALENHGIYVDTRTQNWEIAYNWIHDITGGSLLQFNDNEGGAGTAKLVHGGTWAGFTGMRVHHNWLENAAKYGLNISDPGAGTGQVELRAWNNVIMGTKLPPVRMNSTATTMDITLAYNTIYNAMVSNSGSGNGYFRNEGRGSGAIRVFDNLLAFGASTIGGTSWFYDYSGSSAGWTFKNNLYWDAGRGVAAPSSDTAKVSGDPKFVNAGAGDLSLSATSPAVDKATQALSFTVSDDFTALLTRPLGAANDIGAFELAN
jgi:hypothetical protein